MTAAITASQILTTVAVLTFCVVAGGALGRRWSITKKQRAAEVKITTSLDTTVQELTWAVGGKPDDQWNHERSPGLIEQMGIHRRENREFENTTGDMFAKLLARAERSEDSITAAAATAAKAVLDTASQVAVDKNEAAAKASADILATAIAAKLGPVINKEGGR